MEVRDMEVQHMEVRRSSGRRTDRGPDPESQRGSIPEWVMLLVMGIGVVMALWAIVQPDLVEIVSNALNRLR
jgi:hypothetical protein